MNKYLLGVALVVILGGGGLIYWQNSQTEANPTASNTTIATATPAVNSTYGTSAHADVQSVNTLTNEVLQAVEVASDPSILDSTLVTEDSSTITSSIDSLSLSANGL